MSNTITTLADAEREFGVDHHDYLDKSADIPVVSRIAAQGDVLIVRADDTAPATKAVTSAGYPVVKGENGGNTHALFGPVFYDPSTSAGIDPSDLLLGVLTVPAGQQALLSHPEHGGLLIEPGTYRLKRQREQADVQRFVQD